MGFPYPEGPLFSKMEKDPLGKPPASLDQEEGPLQSHSGPSTDHPSSQLL